MSEERLPKRLELARGHWELGEHDLALLCLERAVIEAPDAPELGCVRVDGRATARATVRRPLEELELRLVPAEGEAATSPDSDIGQLRIEEPEANSGPRAEPAALGQLAARTTSTLAELLADQGMLEQALRVAEDVLRRDPSDARAHAVRDRLQGSSSHRSEIAALEQWLAVIERRQSGTRSEEVRG